MVLESNAAPRRTLIRGIVLASDAAPRPTVIDPRL
jgi:hypothetical protein